MSTWQLLVQEQTLQLQHEKKPQQIVENWLISPQTKDVWKNGLSCCSAASDHEEKTTRSRRHHPSVAFTAVFLQTGHPIWSRAMLWSAQTAHKNKSDRLRDTLVMRTTTKHTRAYFEDNDREHETAEYGLFMLSMKWGRAALHWWNKVTGKEKVNCQSVYESVYTCVCVWGVLQPNSRVQRHSCHKYSY